jgi:hypothetical protein
MLRTGYALILPHLLTPNLKCFPWYNSKVQFLKTMAPCLFDTSRRRLICSSRARRDMEPESSPTSTSATRIREPSTRYLSTTTSNFPTSLSKYRDCNEVEHDVLKAEVKRKHSNSQAKIESVTRWLESTMMIFCKKR